MNRARLPFKALLLATVATLAMHASAAVSASEANKLKEELTPMGAERAGNAAGTIPAWSGGMTTVPAGYQSGGRRPDPFNDKPLYTITGKNMAQYADKLSDGVKALLQKNPDSFRVDVYKTQRTAAAPTAVYDDTFKNATRASLVDGAGGPMPKGAHGGIPFPIPKTGAEVMWNHLLHWRGVSAQYNTNGTMGTSDGKLVTTVEGQALVQMPFYDQASSAQTQAGEYWLFRMINVGPPIRAGEAVVGRLNLDSSKDQTWVYLTGQRRTRKLPNACCDTPNPATAGIMSFDDIEVFTGRLDVFDWKLVGKQELIVPYNSNKTLTAAKNSQVLMPKHLNPDYVRWELHRVWVVEATLKAGKRHPAVKSRYYVDEDTWMALLGDRWDANGQLWKSNWQLPAAMPDIPAQSVVSFGFHDFVSGAWFVNLMRSETSDLQYKIVPRINDTAFTPEALAGEGVR